MRPGRVKGVSDKQTNDPEYVVLLDEQAQPTGAELKSEVHTDRTPYHLAFSSYILNAQGQILITRRALSKVAWPGVWTNSACGHPGLVADGQPESFTDTIIRRAEQELGTTVTNIRRVLADFSYRAVDASGIVEWEFCPVFVADSAGDVNPQEDEVCDYRWVAPADLFAAVDATPWAFSPWMVEQLMHRELRVALTESQAD